MEEILIGGYDQRVEITARVVGSVCIGTVEDHRERMIFLLDIADNLFHSNLPYAGMFSFTMT